MSQGKFMPHHPFLSLCILESEEEGILLEPWNLAWKFDLFYSYTLYLIPYMPEKIKNLLLKGI